jgi:nucleoside-diphosphate-sugar epimerase
MNPRKQQRLGLSILDFSMEIAMKSLVTGCAGFIGSHLTEKLLENQEVTGIDFFTDYYSRETKKNNMNNFINNPSFEFIEQDILKADLKKVVSKVDIVYHIAAQPGVRASWGEKFKIYTDNNVLATQRLLEACKNSSTKKFVYSSSSSIYGDVRTLPMKESDIPHPISPYGVTKLAGEHLCNLYFNNSGVSTVILRYFTVYGPRQRPDMAFNRFLNSIETGRKITVFGDGKQTRDFTFASDIVDGTIKAGKNRCSGETFNLAGGSRISVLDVISIMEELTGKKANVEHIEDQKGDVRDTYADISKAKNILGYEPQVNIRKGLELYLEWLRSE